MVVRGVLRNDSEKQKSRAFVAQDKCAGPQEIGVQFGGAKELAARA
jgi:hypothetical protein